MSKQNTELVPERRTSDFSPKTIRDFNRVNTDPIAFEEQVDVDTPSSPPFPVVMRRILTPQYPLVDAAPQEPTESTADSSEPWGEWAETPEAHGRKSNGASLATALLCLAGIACVGGLTFGAYVFGESVGRESAKSAAPSDEVKVASEFPAESLPRLDSALQLMRDHDGVGAFQAMEKLIRENPDARSIRYGAAMAAMMAGYRNDARRLLDRSISKSDHVSDSLALKASLEQGTDPRTQEALLRSAIAADPMNPSPFIELANLLRSDGRTDEALLALESARLRLLPVDSHAVVNTTIALLTLEKAEVSALPDAPVATGIAERDFPAAYLLLRQENFDAAAALLTETSKQIPADLFSFLINDPAMRKYAREPALAALYR